MKKIFIGFLSFFFICNLQGETFTTSDPPMIYIYHFVSYDSTTVISKSTPKEGLFKLPFSKPNDIIKTGDELVAKPVDPKLLSTMVTTAVGNFPQIKIAGESIQSRIQTDNIIEIVQSYDYPKQTDFVIIGEINALILSELYEIDLKVIDVSRQDIISSKSIQLAFDKEQFLRARIETHISQLIQKLLIPFTGNIIVKVDSTSWNKVRWDYMAIRPANTMVGGNTVNTTDKDFEIKTLKQGNDFLFTSHPELINRFEVLGIMVNTNGNPYKFLEGEYVFRAYLKNNADYFQTTVFVIPGNMNEIAINFEPEPQEEPTPSPIGSIIVNNIQDGIGFELIDDSTKSTIINGNKINGELQLDEFTRNNNTFTSSSLTKYDRNGDIKISESENSILIENVYIGKYYLNYFSLANESFPGKMYIIKYNDTDSLRIDRRNEQKIIAMKNIPSRNEISGKGKDVVIYFHPYPPENEFYRLYDENGNVFCYIRNAGEVQVLGIDQNFNGTYTVKRNGFKPAVINISQNDEKIYALADLTTPVENPRRSLLEETYKISNEDKLTTAKNMPPQYISPTFIGIKQHDQSVETSGMNTSEKITDTAKDIDKPEKPNFVMIAGFIALILLIL